VPRKSGPSTLVRRVFALRAFALRAFALRVFALVLGAVVLSAAVVSGTSYLWCVPMARAVAAACDVEHEHAARPSLHRVCCETQQIGELPPSEGRLALAANVPPPALTLLPNPPTVRAALALLPTLQEVVPRRQTRDWRSRAGPTCASERCIALRVFHC
jgi:hypothetical protein